MKRGDIYDNNAGAYLCEHNIKIEWPLNCFLNIKNLKITNEEILLN